MMNVRFVFLKVKIEVSFRMRFTAVSLLEDTADSDSLCYSQDHNGGDEATKEENNS